VLKIKKMLEVYQEKYNRKIGHCVLIGQSSQLFGFADYLASKLSVSISSGSPFARIIYPSWFQPVSKELGSSLAIAVGLAMRKK